MAAELYDIKKRKSRFPVRVIEFLHSKKTDSLQGPLTRIGRKLLVLE